MNEIDFIFVSAKLFNIIKRASFRVVYQKRKQEQKGTLIWLYSKNETEYIIQLCILFLHA